MQGVGGSSPLPPTIVRRLEMVQTSFYLYRPPEKDMPEISRHIRGTNCYNVFTIVSYDVYRWQRRRRNTNIDIHRLIYFFVEND